MLHNVFWGLVFGFMGTMFLALVTLAVLIKLQ
jgi:hypothetical protein